MSPASAPLIGSVNKIKAIHYGAFVASEITVTHVLEVLVQMPVILCSNLILLCSGNISFDDCAF
jgi:hypothetical protein